MLKFQLLQKLTKIGLQESWVPALPRGDLHHLPCAALVVAIWSLPDPLLPGVGTTPMDGCSQNQVARSLPLCSTQKKHMADTCTGTYMHAYPQPLHTHVPTATAQRMITEPSLPGVCVGGRFQPGCGLQPFNRLVTLISSYKGFYN